MVNIPLAAGFMVSSLYRQGFKGSDLEILQPDISDIYGDKALEMNLRNKAPSILALSLYLWNSQRSLFLASRLKREIPGLKVIVGGPEVTEDNEWILEHPAVDCGVFGEGETVIGPLLKALETSDSMGVARSVFQKIDGQLHFGPPRGAGPSLESLEYPYSSGILKPGADGTVFVETLRGCPFKCAYCYYHKAHDRIRLHSRENLERLWQRLYSRDSGVREIYLMDPTFNMRPGFREILTSLANKRKERDIRLHTELRADFLDQEDVRLLVDAGLKTAEVGLQTTNIRALEIAGRPMDPEKMARGVHMLKSAGVEVTTGIIIGLPGDSPAGVRSTLAWLKETGAYSSVHPFTLSILPGTDFRLRAKELSIEYDPRPPYYVRKTDTWTEELITEALLECEDQLDMTMDYLPGPSLVDRGADIVMDPEGVESLSKWIIGLDNGFDPRGLGEMVAGKITNCFTLWFRGKAPDKHLRLMGDLVAALSAANPHCHMEIVLEFDLPPDPEILGALMEEGCEPAVYLNKHMAPLHGADSVVSPSLNVIATIEAGLWKLHMDAYGSGYPARVIWELKDFTGLDLCNEYPHILISPEMTASERGAKELIEELWRLRGDRPGGVRFKDPEAAAIWRKRLNRLEPVGRERIFIS
jgi:tRNA A37 methylthiotransferase MiaB